MSAPQSPDPAQRGLSAYWNRLLHSRYRRPIWISQAALFFCFTTWWAFIQPVHPDACRPTYSSVFAKVGDADWWLYPVERHAFLRLPLVNEPIYDSFQLPKTNKVWAVGGGGLVLHSEDAGRTWITQEVPKSIPPAPSLPNPSKPDIRERDPKQQFPKSGPPDGAAKKGASFPTPALPNNGRVLNAAYTSPLPDPQESQPDPKASPTKGDFKNSKAPPPLSNSPAPNNAADPRQQQPPNPAQITPPSLRTLPTPQSTESAAHALIAVTFINDRQGWIASEIGEVFTTVDGGATWVFASNLPRLAYPQLRAAKLVFLDATRGVCLRADRDNGDDSYFSTVITNDGGKSWGLGAFDEVDALGADRILAAGLSPGQAFWHLTTRALYTLENNSAPTWTREWSPPALPGIIATPNAPAIGNQSSSPDGIVCGLKWDDSTLVILQSKSLTSYDLAAKQVVETIDAARLNLNNAILVDAAILGPRAALLYTSDNRVLQTFDKGKTWKERIADPAFLDRARVISLLCNDLTGPGPVPIFKTAAQAGFRTGARFTATASGELAWSQVTRPQILQYDSLRADALCYMLSGELFSTIDNGATWRITTDLSGYGPISLDIVNERLAFAITADGAFRRCTDGGLTWKTVATNLKDATFAGVDFIDANTGWALIQQSPAASSVARIYRTANGGATWTAFSEGLDADVPLGSAVVARDASTCIFIDTEGTISVLLPAKADLFDLADPPRLIADPARPSFDASGALILSYTDGSAYRIPLENPDARWDQVTPPAFTLPPQYNTFGAFPTDRVFAPFVLGPTAAQPFPRTGDAATIAPYRRLPAPWYYLSWLGSLALLSLAFYPLATVSVRRSVSDIGVTDAPVEDFKNDVLGLGALARGVSFFIRNPATQAPLTIGITAPWGAGKSSLMALIRADLRNAGYPTVWFNAWHHQTEERLLASLLDGITKRAAPSLLTGEGILFRLRLGWRRIADLWRSRPVFFSVIIFAAVVWGAALTYWIKHPALEQTTTQTSTPAPPPKPTITNSIGLFGATYTQRIDPPKPPAADSDKKDNKPTDWTDLASIFDFLTDKIKNSAPELATALTLIAALIGPVRKVFSTFGVDPGKLIGGDGESAAQLKQKTSFRARFTEEFKQVTDALGNNRKLVIFIDDLDRCEAANVADMLQTANYLVTAGKCIIIMGFDELYVRICMEMQYKDYIAKRNEKAAAEPDAKARSSKDFAREYLEKLINIEIPVPDPTSAAAKKLIVPKKKASVPAAGAGASPAADPDEDAPLVWWERGLLHLPTASRWAATSIALVAICAWAIELGYVEIPKRLLTASTAPANRLSGVASLPPKPTTTDTAQTAKPPLPLAKTDLAAPTTPALIETPTLPRLGMGDWPLFLALLTFITTAIAFAAANFEKRKRDKVEDSDLFVHALETWFPWVDRTNPTPRVIKRFLNRVRFYAMRQRARILHPYWWRPRPEMPIDATTLPDEFLVAFGAAEQCQRANAKPGETTPSAALLIASTISEIKAFAAANAQLDPANPSSAILNEEARSCEQLIDFINKDANPETLKAKAITFDAIRTGVGFR